MVSLKTALLPDPVYLEPYLQVLGKDFPVSALTGQGHPELLATLLQKNVAAGFSLRWAGQPPHFH
jgi:hypothetical protein